MQNVLGIDIGGTKISYATVNSEGEITGDILKTDTPKSKDEIVEIFKKIIKDYESKVDAVAFATAGAVNLDNTKVASSTPNLPLGYSQIEFISLSSKPVYVENDANAAAFAEYKIGAAKGHANTIIITLGTGIGGGIIVNNKILRGKSGRGGEVGSIKVCSDKRRKCTCNGYDCWEIYASGTGLKISANEMMTTENSFKKSIWKEKKTGEISTYNIVEGIKSNDEFSKKVFDRWQNDLVTGLISLTNIFDPESIVISGGMGEFIDFKKLENAINNSIVVSPIKLFPAAMKNDAGKIGACLLAFEKFA